MSKEKNVVEFYVLCNKLKSLIRKGWKDWNVGAKRLESVAEHVYGTMMLAIAVNSEYAYDIDLKKVLYMLSIHELEEIVIGDLTMFDVTKDEKRNIGHKVVEKILQNLKNKEEIKALVFEFDEQKTKEAQFAYWCDKFEADIQCKLYDEQKCVDLKNTNNCKALKNKEVQKYLNGNKSWAEMWLEFGRNRYSYDENFLKLSNYVEKNNISICNKSLSKNKK